MEEDCQLDFNLFGFVEEIELVPLLLGENTINQLLELLRAGIDWQLVSTKWLIPIIDKMDDDIFRYFHDRLLVWLNFLLWLHINNRLL